MDGPKGLSSLVISHTPKESRPPVFPQGQWAAQQQAREYARYISPGTRSTANDHVFTVLINSASEKGGATPLYKNANKEIARTVSTALITWHEIHTIKS